MTGITLCASSFNEEEHLEKWVKAHKKYVDEIVLVDTGSFDNTVKLAKSLGVRVIEKKWTHSFADAKNWAIEECKTEWCMLMGADWYIDESDMEILLWHVKNNRGNVFSSPTIMHKKDWNKLHEDDEILDYHHEFLFRNRNMKYLGRVHEHCKDAAQANGWGVTPLRIYRHHDSTALQEPNPYKAFYYDLLAKYNGRAMQEIPLADELRMKAYELEVERTRKLNS
jgi:glycosyltransferase involved in cell wall biosynthesis